MLSKERPTIAAMPREKLPQIAIVGRPNVGKSSLLNRLAGRRISIVDPTPGVTRDRVSTLIDLEPPSETPRGTPPIACEIIDTGGYGVYMAEGKRYDDVGADLSTLTADIERQIALAIEQADIILFAIDAQSGLTALDRAIAQQIRQRGAAKKVLPIANKVDDEKWLGHAAEMSALGFGEPIGVSAENAYNIRELRETLYERAMDVSSRSGRAAKGADPEEAEPAKAEIKLAIVGKRNSGKSTLINAWAGEPRVIVSEIAGTTRDSIDVRFELPGHPPRAILAIDTAGLRKRKSFADDIEFYAHSRMMEAIKRCDVALLLLDASAEVSQIDQKLAQELQDQYKPTVIVVNKWDVAEKKGLKTEAFLTYITQQLRGLEYAPIVFVSAKEGFGVKEVLAMAVNLHQQASHRETTGRLNDAIGEIMEQRGPSSKAGARAKVYFVSQVATAPPTIVFSVNKPALFHGQYERYLLNELRERLPYAEVPIKLLFRERERVPLEELKRRKPPGARSEREHREPREGGGRDRQKKQVKRRTAKPSRAAARAQKKAKAVRRRRR
jgi:GTP-binding protein